MLQVITRAVVDFLKQHLGYVVLAIVLVVFFTLMLVWMRANMIVTPEWTW